MNLESRESIIETFVEQNREETILLLKELAVIPAPSHHEEKRAQFCLDWLQGQGAKEAYIDEAGNVVFPYHCAGKSRWTAFMAHMDVVFPDTVPFSVVEDRERLAVPGVGDDTANLVNLLMCIKFLIQNHLAPAGMGILFVANTCEEGLGNLKGCRAVFEQYGGGIEEMISFDCYLGVLVWRAVGSQRYKITVKTRGGHSYADFGETSAIQVIAGIVCRLYQTEVPPEGKTTYNVGIIEGGTSVNTIAESAAICYEFRSDRQSSLACMEKALWQILDSYQNQGADVQAEVLGIRPCGSGEVPPDRFQALVKRQSRIIEQATGKPVELIAGSTDANIPLSLGIPAITFGTVAGAGAHTYGEWIDKGSMAMGQKVALASVMSYVDRVTKE